MNLRDVSIQQLSSYSQQIKLIIIKKRKSYKCLNLEKKDEHLLLLMGVGTVDKDRDARDGLVD